MRLELGATAGWLGVQLLLTGTVAAFGGIARRVADQDVTPAEDLAVLWACIGAAMMVLAAVYRFRSPWPPQRALRLALAGQEGTFIICSFWLVQNLTLAGEIDKARRLLDKLRGYANDLGLFSEEFDTRTGEMLGNFPQAFSHLAFVNSAVLLDRLS